MLLGAAPSGLTCATCAGVIALSPSAVSRPAWRSALTFDGIELRAGDHALVVRARARRVSLDPAALLLLAADHHGRVRIPRRVVHRDARGVGVAHRRPAGAERAVGRRRGRRRGRRGHRRDRRERALRREAAARAALGRRPLLARGRVRFAVRRLGRCLVRRLVRRGHAAHGNTGYAGSAVASCARWTIATAPISTSAREHLPPGERVVEEAPGDDARRERLHHLEVAGGRGAGQREALEVDDERDAAGQRREQREPHDGVRGVRVRRRGPQRVRRELALPSDDDRHAHQADHHAQPRRERQRHLVHHAAAGDRRQAPEQRAEQRVADARGRP